MSVSDPQGRKAFNTQKLLTREQQKSEAEFWHTRGYSNVAIAAKMYLSESMVRDLLKEK